MRIESLTVVIVKSYPLLVESYSRLLGKVTKAKSQGFRVLIETAFDYQSAIDLFNRLWLVGRDIDLVILDLKVFDLSKEGYLAGEDIGLFVRERDPEAKIIFTTTFMNQYRVSSIIKSIKPEGFLVKSDVDSIIFKRAIREVLNDSYYYSRQVAKWINKLDYDGIVLDKWDRLLLYELSQNVKMKNLPQKIPLSLAAIEKRKRRIKSIFEVEQGDDHQLLLYARKFGFV